MQKDLFQAIKDNINTNLPAIKSVRLWNNQPNREKVENAFLYPIVFVEFKETSYKPLLLGVEHFQQIVTLHLGFESYLDEDLNILQLKQDLFQVMLLFQQPTTAAYYFSNLVRLAERQNFDHNNIQMFEIDYLCGGKDFTADIRSKQVYATASLHLGATYSATASNTGWTPTP